MALKTNKLSYEYIESWGFRQLGQRPIWSNISYQLHQYPGNWGVFKRDDSNVLYKDTGITLSTEEELLNWLNSVE